MGHIVLIACAKGKFNVRSKACDLYDSELFRKSLRYARSLKPDAIYILSAEHGLLPLDKEVEPYEKTLNKMPKQEVEAWGARVLGQLRAVSEVGRDRFTFLASDRYRRTLLPYLPNHEVPLKGLGIGRQLQFLKERTG